GRFVFDAAATGALGAPLLANPRAGRLDLHTTDDGRLFGVLVAPDQPAGTTAIGGASISTRLDYGLLQGGTWSKRTVATDAASLPPQFTPRPGAPLTLSLASADAPGTLWTALTAGPPTTSGRFPLILGRFDGSRWRYPATGLDVLDLSDAFATSSAAAVTATRLFADGSTVWIGAHVAIGSGASTVTAGDIVARYDGATAELDASWCDVGPQPSSQCAQPLDADHPAAVPDVSFGAVALAMQGESLSVYRDGFWSVAATPGYRALGAFTSPDDGWLVGQWGAGHWMRDAPPSPLVTWPQANRSPLTAVALPPGSDAATAASGGLAVG